MQCRGRLIAKSVRSHMRERWVPTIVAYAVPLLCIQGTRLLRVSRSRRSSDLSNSTSSILQIAGSPLKIASASGNTPPPEDPEDTGDNESSQKDEISSLSARPITTDSFARPPSRARGRPRGSSSRRGLKPLHSRKATVFKPNIPEWFISRNVTLFGYVEHVRTTTCSDTSDTSPSTHDTEARINSIPQTRIPISPFIRKEFEAHLSAALLVQSGRSQENLAARKTHIHLQCPKRGAIYFLDEIIESAAKALEADIVSLDGQDLDELLEMLIDPTSSEVGIGHPQIFFTNIMRHSKDADQRDEVNEEENEELEDDEETTEDSAEFRLPPDMPMRLFRLFAPRPLYPSGIHSSSSAFFNPARPSEPKEDTDTKVSTYLDLLVSAPIDKRKSLMKRLQRNGGDMGTTFQLLTGSNRTIVYLRDFQSILDSSRGQIAHQALLNVIRNRRRLGEKIVLVVSDDLPNENVNATSFANDYYHIIKIPPPLSQADKLALQKDRDARTREINLRSIQSAIRQRSHTPSMELECPVGIHLDASATSSIHGLDKDIWELGKVQRVASIAMGNYGRWQVEHRPQQTVPITIADVAQAVEDMKRADKERAESKQEQKAAREVVDPLERPRDVKRENPQLAPINSKDCNKHEQRLLGGVIDPEKIHVRFSDIRAPESTIQTLKILVSLPLKRPDAFSYGVLSKNFINGVLLFGPPGTGKTMLAKAVARESGARVLEIKGSEVYDMYVGEGEKNVKAIFSLARKLSPCVVFIDEVDTIFSSRNGSERHVSHREIINQFMAEWDGISALNSGVLILGATNRPFDLDDAILRRMPRRILVDLPTEEDRFVILKLLLADEVLDPDVDLRGLAQRTNLYSGSDLKNVCVSAAVTAVTEEKASVDILGGANDGDTEDGNAALAEAFHCEALVKRVLRPSHFEKALTEVTPSISESMETIDLLRKFDKKYGNAKDKKKKLMGFGTETPEAVANVRILNP